MKNKKPIDCMALAICITFLMGFCFFAFLIVKAANLLWQYLS